MNSQIKIVINKGTIQEQIVPIDVRILNFGIELLHGDHSDEYELPAEAATSAFPLQMMQIFLEAHHYSPESVRVKMPINSKKYDSLVDQITFQHFSKYTDLKHIEEANSILNLAKFLNFTELYNVVGAAIATNFYIGDDDKQITAFIKQNKIEKLSPAQIGQIIQEYSEVFNQIGSQKESHMIQPQ